MSQLSLEVGPYTLDRAQLLLFRGAEEVPLAPKPLQILLVLAESGGRVVSHEELRRRVWPDGATSSGNLHQAMSVLRRTLGSGPDGSELVENVQKRGYRLVVPGRPAPAAKPVSFAAPKRLRGSRLVVGFAVAAGLAFAAALLVRGRRPDTPIRMLTVLPFESGSVQPELGVFLADAVALRLADVRGVSARFQQGGSAQNMDSARAIGRSSGIDLVVSGSIRPARGGFGVAVSVLDVREDTRQWSESWGGSLLDLESTVAGDVLRLLPLQPTRGEHRRLARRETRDELALRSFLKGRSLAREPRRLPETLEALGLAVSRDPLFARAHAALAEAEIAAARERPQETEPAVARAREAARAAVRLDESLADGHAALATLLATRDWDFAGAERAFRRAIELRPNDAEAHLRYGLLLTALAPTDRYGEAVPELRRAAALSPHSGLAEAGLAFALFSDGERSAADDQGRRAAALAPDSPWPSFSVGLVDLALDRREAALAALERAVRVSGGGATFEAAYAYALARAGHFAAARVLLSKLTSPGSPAIPYDLAPVYDALGERDRAFALLARAIAERSEFVMFLASDPRYHPLRGDPHFAAILEKLRLSLVLHREVR